MSNEGGETPVRWRAQFPYRQDADDRVARRQLLQFCVYTSGALFVGTGALAVLGQLHAPISNVVKPILPSAELAEGQAHYFRYPSEGDQAMLLRLPGGRLVAFSQKCTHLSCAVLYQPEKKRLFCPCHEGVFNPQTGDPVAGPPKRRLPQVLLREQEGMIVAVGMVP
jgi:nitrite reductase/ring-hydroxylating ferredoxin subunit